MPPPLHERDKPGDSTAGRGSIIAFPPSRPAESEPAVFRLRSDPVFEPSQFWAVLDMLPVAILIARGRDCSTMEGNAAARTLLRMPPGQNLSQSAPDPEKPSFMVVANGVPVPPENLPMQRAAATGQPIPRSECEVRFPNGDVVFVAGHSVPLFDQAGAVCGSIGVFVDVTHTKLLERENQRLSQELRRLNAGLERRVQQVLDEREIARARLTENERIYALGQLASGIAHDINNVLQAVQVAAGMIERRPTDPGRVVDFARMASEAAERGSGVTRRVLALSRVRQDRTEVVDPVLLLENLREILTHTLGTRITVQVDAAAGLPRFGIDKDELETVILNLAANARDAMSGEGVVTLAAVHQMVGAASRAGQPSELTAGSYVRLSVRDTGGGMTPELMARVTEPFFTTKPPGKGTGLGLAMARAFAEKAGGHLSLDSVVGEGTSVHLWLPVAGGARSDGHGE